MSTILMSKYLWNSSLALIYHMQFIQTGQLSAAYQFKLKLSSAKYTLIFFGIWVSCPQ